MGEDLRSLAHFLKNSNLTKFVSYAIYRNEDARLFGLHHGTVVDYLSMDL
jgi:hypothetical protein